MTLAGQGNCNINAHSQTHDRWCYVTKHSRCPDARQSKVRHGRYWSNQACNNDYTRNKGKRSAVAKPKTTWNMMERLGELLR